MKRRSFLKKTAAAGLVTWITPSAVLTQLSAKPTIAEPSFVNPGIDYAPHTWWHWMNGNISKEGITLDLEAMSSIGLGGFQMFEVGTGIPKGPISYLSDEWLELMKHTVKECKRLGLAFAMHNCPGWSSSGGPWITPDLSMQQLTWSETTVKGGKRFNDVLAEPPKILDFYKDSAIIAFPSPKSEKTPWTAQLKELKVNGESIDTGQITANGYFNRPQSFGKTDSPGVIDFIFQDPYPLASLTMLSSGNGKVVLQQSKDGNTYETVRVLTDANPGNPNSHPSYLTASFTKQQASRYRLTFQGVLKISSLLLSGNARLDNWLSKANFPGSKAIPISATTAFSDEDAIAASSIIDLSILLKEDGKLDWAVPPGDWTILRVGHTPVGRMNKSAPTTGTGLDCDKFTKSAFDYHWDRMFKSILPLMRSLEDGKIGLLIDSYELGLQNWSASFPQEFEQRKTYSLLPFLPALTGRIIDDAATTESFLRDFRQAQGDVMADHYYGRFTELCHANNIVSYTEPYEGGNFEEMKIGRAVDISMGEFWAGHTMLYNNSVLDRTMKVAASIAHSKGQSIVGAEAFTAEPGSGKWQQYPFSMKSLGDFMFTKGLTRIIFHRYAHQPHPSALPGMTMGPWGIHFDRTNTWFAKSGEWVRYLSRCQYLLRTGHFVADIAYYVGQEVPGRTINPEQTKWALPAGYDYDLINTECILKECRMENGRLHNGHGVSYRVLVLPGIEILSLAVLKRLASFVDQGLILIGEKPQQSFGIKDRSAEGEFERLVAKLWGKSEKQLNGKVFPEPEMNSILPKLGLAPDFEYTSEHADAAINFIHRSEKDRDIYFVANRRRRTEDIVCHFRTSLQSPELWDPITGKTASLTFFERKDGTVRLPLKLQPSGSVFIIFTKKPSATGYLSLDLNGKRILDARKSWPKSHGIYPTTHSNFTVTCLVKPETDISLREDGFYGDRRTANYAAYPAAGALYYGQGHACSGFTVGRNGIALFERSGSFIEAVLFVEIPIAGWSRLTIVYEHNIPTVYLNNKAVKTGNRSGKIVHPSIFEAYQDDLASYYNGEICDIKLTDYAVRPDAISQLKLTLPTIEIDQNFLQHGDGNMLRLWKNGFYNLTNQLGQEKRFQVWQLPEKPLELKANWQVKFPTNSGAPDQIKMPYLLPLQQHEDPGVRYFSGTAEYLHEFSFTVPDYPHQIILDLGRVEVLAEAKLNGISFPVVWTQPYCLDITKAIKNGINRLSVKVTNLWPNRLIGDEQLPEENEYAVPANDSKLAIGGAGGIKKLPEWYTKGQAKPSGGRMTFSTWKHYDEHSPLLESGLQGPVRITVGYLQALTKR